MSWFEDLKEKVSTWEREHFFWAEISAIIGAITFAVKWLLHATGLEPKLIETAKASPVIFGLIVLSLPLCFLTGVSVAAWVQDRLKISVRNGIPSSREARFSSDWKSTLCLPPS